MEVLLVFCSETKSFFPWTVGEGWGRNKAEDCFGDKFQRAPSSFSLLNPHFFTVFR